MPAGLGTGLAGECARPVGVPPDRLARHTADRYRRGRCSTGALGLDQGSRVLAELHTALVDTGVVGERRLAAVRAETALAGECDPGKRCVETGVQRPEVGDELLALLFDRRHHHGVLVGTLAEECRRRRERGHRLSRSAGPLHRQVAVLATDRDGTLDGVSLVLVGCLEPEVLSPLRAGLGVLSVWGSGGVGVGHADGGACSGLNPRVRDQRRDSPRAGLSGKLPRVTAG